MNKGYPNIARGLSTNSCLLCDLYESPDHVYSSIPLIRSVKRPVLGGMRNSTVALEDSLIRLRGLIRMLTAMHIGRFNYKSKIQRSKRMLPKWQKGP